MYNETTLNHALKRGLRSFTFQLVLLTGLDVNLCCYLYNISKLILQTLLMSSLAIRHKYVILPLLFDAVYKILLINFLYPILHYLLFSFLKSYFYHKKINTKFFDYRSDNICTNFAKPYTRRCIISSPGSRKSNEYKTNPNIHISLSTQSKIKPVDK